MSAQPNLNCDFRHILKGICPILNVGPETDVDSLLSWAVKLHQVGINLVQLRVKRITETALPSIVDDLTLALKGSGLAVILNDFVELVPITGADGVHLGLEDFPIPSARKFLGPEAIIGATCRTLDQALPALSQGASYIAAGSVFPSKTKPGLPIIGIEGLKYIVEGVKEVVPPNSPDPAWRLPVCAIGGIDIENLPLVYAAGARMVAVIDAIQGRADPLASAKALVEKWEQLERE